MSEEQDRRRRKRVLYSIDAKIELEDKQVYYPEVHDISMSGIFLKSDEPLSINTKGLITIRLILGDIEENVKSEFIVQRIVAKGNKNQPPGFAVQFTELDSDSSIVLFNMIKYQSGEVFD